MNSRAEALTESSRAARLLEMVPTKNSALHVERKPEGLVVWVPLLRPAWMAGIVASFLPLRSKKGYALDVLGCEVFDACDGKHTVEQIIETFAQRHRVRFHEARQSVQTYLRWLVERKVIALVLGVEANV